MSETTLIEIPENQIVPALRLAQFLRDLVPAGLEEDARELIRKRRVLDLNIQSGSATAKVHSDDKSPSRVELLFPVLTSDEWNTLLEEMSKEAYYLAMLLNDTVPNEIEDLFASHGMTLIPQDPTVYQIRENGQKVDLTELSPSYAAFVLRLCDKIESDPFSVLILRGIGHDELLHELRKRRTLLKKDKDFKPSLHYKEIEYEPAPPLVATIPHYWSAGGELNTLSYTIKADELPSSILKWLDPLPLGGLEDKVDFMFEEAYERIARLAQSYGLGL
jgi:uncharacterized Zn finger protein